VTDPRIVNLARIISDYSVRIKPDDQVVILAEPIAAPLVRELYRLALRRGAHPLVLTQTPGLDAIFYQESNESQLQYVSPVLKQIVETFDVRIRIESESNTRELSAVDPARQRTRSKAYAPLMRTMMERGATGDLRWNVCLFPTDAYAQEADMSLADFEDFVYSACLADQPDPVASWTKLKERQQAMIDWLAGKREVRIVGPDTDLTLGIAGRPFINCWGDNNMPDGEIFTSPEETKVNGRVRFSYPAITHGREVEDVRLWFEDGRVVQATAAKNEAFLAATLDTDPGARRLGEFAFGTNTGIQRFIKNTLFDEKIGGTVHMALGAGYPESGSQNDSAIHWDLVCDLRTGGEVFVDGELFAKDGEILI
jgi:aminopeptidase